MQWVSSIGLNGMFQGGVHHEVSDSSLAEVRVPHSPAGFPGAIVAGGRAALRLDILGKQEDYPVRFSLGKR